MRISFDAPPTARSRDVDDDVDRLGAYALLATFGLLKPAAGQYTCKWS